LHALCIRSCSTNRFASESSFASGLGILKYLADPMSQLQEMTFWMLGGLSGTTWGTTLMVIVCDTLACSLPFYEIPLGIITSLLGAPLFLSLLSSGQVRFKR